MAKIGFAQLIRLICVQTGSTEIECYFSSFEDAIGDDFQFRYNGTCETELLRLTSNLTLTEMKCLTRLLQQPEPDFFRGSKMQSLEPLWV